jgi:hypothetical protein
MAWFLTEVWPVLRVKKPHLRFKIVGKTWRLQELFSDTEPAGAPSGTPHSQFSMEDWTNIGIYFLEFVEQNILDDELFP